MNNLPEKPDLPIIAYLYSANNKHIVFPDNDEKMAKEVLETDEITVTPLSDNKASLAFTAAYLERYTERFMRILTTALPESTEVIQGLGDVTNLVFNQLIDELKIDNIIEEIYGKPSDPDLH